MGLINFGIPESETLYLKNKLALTSAIEGGTYTGGTARFLAGHFDHVFTIEKSDVMFAKAEQNLSGISNVQLLKGDTRQHLRELADQCDNCLFWLDSHWSGGDTYGRGDECPLIEELNILFSSRMQNFVVLIDDARLFLAPPPKPHDYTAWPGLREVVQVVPEDYDLIVYDDVIFITPKRLEFSRYLQDVVTDQLKSSGSNIWTNKIKSLVKKASS